MRFVPVKSIEQQAVLTLHRVRQGYIAERTASINRMRALLEEFGVVIAQGSNRARKNVLEHLDQLPFVVVNAVKDLLDHLQTIDDRVRLYDKQLLQLTRENDTAQRLQSIPGSGRSRRRQLSPQLEMLRSFVTDDSLLHGSAWCRDSIRLAVKHASATSRKVVTRTCECCLLWVPAPCSSGWRDTKRDCPNGLLRSGRDVVMAEPQLRLLQRMRGFCGHCFEKATASSRRRR